MKTKNTEQNYSEEVIKKLTGHYESDRKILVESISNFRKKNVPTIHCQNLGVKLYRLLLENGLNESDVINVDRLLDKIDGFLYNGQTDLALGVLDVMDAVSKYQKYDPEGRRVYCFENEIEAKIFENDGIITKEIAWIHSARTNFMMRKAKILFKGQKIKEALDIIEDVLELNPVYFPAYLLKAQCFRDKSPKKFKELLEKAQKYAYTPDHFIQLFVNFYNYYADKEDWINAYAVLSAVKVYEINDELLDSLEALKIKMTRTVVTPFKVPSPEQILTRLENEGIMVQISEQNYGILIEIYERLFMEQEDMDFMKQVAGYIQAFAGQEDILKIIEKRLKK